MSQNPTQSSLDLVLAATHGQLLTPLALACEIVGYSPKTYRNKESAGKALPFPATPGRRRVDVRDLAAYLDSLRITRAPAIQTSSEVQSTPAPRRRGRPPKSGKAAGARRLSSEAHC